MGNPFHLVLETPQANLGLPRDQVVEGLTE
jgi:hypothetical protein